jgi:hypothetical protein
MNGLIQSTQSDLISFIGTTF